MLEKSSIEMRGREPEVAEAAREIARSARMARLMQDPEIRAAMPAIGRTIANGVITIADIFPILGTLSWIADALKFFGRNSGLDLTPSVSKKLALGTEALEPLALGFLPSHGIEAILQLKREDGQRSGKHFRPCGGF